MNKISVFLISSILLIACGNGARDEGINHTGAQGEDGHYEIDIMEMDNTFYEVLIDTFCRTYYDRKLPGHYVGESISVTSFSRKDSHTVEVRGTHSFKGRDFYVNQKQYDNRGFVATVIYSGANEYLINFSRRLELPGPLGPGEWKYTGELPIAYNSNLHNNIK